MIEEKREALRSTRITGFIGFIVGMIGTVILGGILYMMISADQMMLDGSGETVSTLITLSIGYTLPVYFAVFLAMCYMGLLMLNSLWIFIRFLFVRAEAYDLENEPSFRM